MSRSTGDVKELIRYVLSFEDEIGRQPDRMEIAASLGWARSALANRITYLVGRGLATRDSGSNWGATLTDEAKASVDGDEKLTPDQQALAAAHLRYANRIADHFLLGFQTDSHDVYSAAQLGLCQAAARFDPSLGLSFKTFATRRITGAILDALRASGVQTRPARSGVQAGPDKPTKKRPRTISLFRELGVEPDTGRRETLADVLVDKDCPSDGAIRDAEHRDHLDHLASKLGRGGDVLRMYYGDRARAMEEIGDELGVSQSWVSLLHTKTISKIKGNPERYGFCIEGKTG